MKKTIHFLAAMLISTAATTAPAMAQADNSCGDNLTWSISGETLVIEVYGAMWDYSYTYINQYPYFKTDAP